MNFFRAIVLLVPLIRRGHLTGSPSPQSPLSSPRRVHLRIDTESQKLPAALLMLSSSVHQIIQYSLPATAANAAPF